MSSIPSEPGVRNAAPPRSDIASLRRDQVIDAAIAIIVEKGLPNLSLSKIEERAGMSRGQLTHYFPTKEDILLAVFDRMIERMHENSVAKGMPPPPCIQNATDMWTHLRLFLYALLGREPVSPEFHALHYTFLSQIGHREDFRERLASLYERWRNHLSADLEKAHAQRPPGSERTSYRVMASFIQAIIHGVSVQLDADPKAFNRVEMVEFILAVLAPWFQMMGNDHE